MYGIFYFSTIKTLDHGLPEVSIACFNSILVRLRLFLLISFGAHCTSFNSTLVRLRRSNEVQASSPFASFNSTLVRLRLKPLIDAYDSVICFNSTLVRLRQVGNKVWAFNCGVSILL